MTGVLGDDVQCRTGRRRDLLRRLGINGIDAVEVGDDGLSLTVFFLAGVPDGLGPENVRIDGGAGPPRPVVVAVGAPEAADGPDDPDEPDCVTVLLDRIGDACPYTLGIVETDARGRPSGTPYPGFDPRYASAPFSFTQICASDLDCADACTCSDPPLPAGAPRDYLARDYPTFRRLLLDRMALVAPGWRERRVPDLGVTLVEMLSYVADHLSYYQDAVATEAYLDTARQRISVRRHGRLVDHVLGEGTNARAFVVVAVDTELTVANTDVGFVTGYPGVPPVGRALSWSTVDAQRAGSFEEFRPLLAPGVEEITFRPDHDRITIHTWGDDECCLPAGATSATLVEPPGGLALACGDFLLFEEVRGPRTGQPGDADPTHRHVVRLTRVGDDGYDRATETAVRQVWWAPPDALPFALCLSSLGPAPRCEHVRDVSVARANVVLVDHGRRIVGETLPPVPGGPVEEACDGPCRPAEVVRRAGRFRPRLARPGLTHAEPLPPGEPCECGATHGPSAATALVRDPSAAVPVLRLEGTGRPWSAVPDLLGSGPDDRAVVAEMDDERVAWLRFGDDRTGEEPEPGIGFTATYRVGNGAAGNVGAGAIRYLVLRAAGGARVLVDNPLPAAGGTEPESVADAKMLIPAAFRSVRERAVTADDYAELGIRIGGADLQSAAADLVWTGSWYVADVALDPRVGSRPARPCAPPDTGVEGRVAAGLQRYRRMGHDLEVATAQLVPIDLELTVCVAPHAVAAHVKAALLELFTSGTRRDGTPGWFHPDRWTFGQPVAASPIIAAATGVPGVLTADVTRLARADDPGTDAVASVPAVGPDGAEIRVPGSGVLAIGRREIASLRPGPDRTLGGRLGIVPIGGR